jgi:histone H3/H4
MASQTKGGKKSNAAAGGKRKAGHRKPKRSWGVYVLRALKRIQENDKKNALSMSSKAMAIMNSFCTDVFERVASEAATLARVNHKRTLGSREVQTAVRLTLPTELARHAAAEGTKAMAKLVK